MATPTAIIKGDNVERSKVRICATTVVPTSAPSNTASAGAVVMMPWLLKEDVSRAVALLLCSKTVTPRPAKNALKRLERLAPNALRTSLPQASVMPMQTPVQSHRC